MEQIKKRRYCKLAPREHGKSIVESRVFPQHYALFNQDKRILLGSKTYTLSNEFLTVIFDDLHRPRLQRDFKHELSMLKRVGNKIWVNRFDKGIKEATITAVGVGGLATGDHFDLILLEDLVDDLSCRTEGSREFVRKWLGATVEGVLAPNGIIHVIGTRKHPEDIYQTLIENPRWDVSVEKAIIQEPSHYEYIYELIDGKKVVVDVDHSDDYEILWEDEKFEFAWTMKKLLLKRLEMGALFDREYQNDATAATGNLFKTKWLRYYTTNLNNVADDIVLMPRHYIDKVQGWDFAIGQDQDNDFTVCCTLYVDDLNRVFVSFYRDKIDFPTAVKMVKQQYLKESNPRVRVIGMEANQFQKGYRQTVQGQLIMPVKDITQTSDKVMRIQTLSPFFENGTIYVNIEDEDFFNEYRAFQRGCKHDDMLDALKIAMDLLFGESTVRISSRYLGK